MSVFLIASLALFAWNWSHPALIVGASSPPPGRKAEEGVRNVALRQPCQPAGICTELVDGAFGATRWPLQKGLGRDSTADGTGHSRATRASLGSRASPPIVIFLEERFFVAQVVVFCTSQRGRNISTGSSHELTLTVTIWVKGSTGDKDEIGVANRHDDVKKANAVFRRTVVAIAQVETRGILRFELAINSLATAVKVELGSEVTDAVATACPDCGAPLQPVELEIMGRKPRRAAPLRNGSVLPGPTSPRSSPSSRDIAVARPPSEPIAQTFAARRTSLASLATPVFTGEGNFSDASASVEILNEDYISGFLASTREARTSMWALVVTLCVYLLFPALVLVLTARLWRLKGLSVIKYEPLPEIDAEAAYEHFRRPDFSIRDPGAPRCPTPHRTPELFHIGSPESSRESSPAPQPLRQRQFHAHSSESEPEGEMDPESASNSPRSAALATDQQVLMLYASPLCHTDPRGSVTPLPQIDFEREWNVLAQAHQEATAVLRPAVPRASGAWARRRKSQCRLEARPLTASSLRCAIASLAEMPSVLHISAHGVQDCLILDNGRASAHPLGPAQIGEMLGLRCGLGSRSDLRLVILNACSVERIGMEFVHGGIPHVICTSSDIGDTASHIFVHAIYGSLFQGASVAQAFGTAIVAVRSDPAISTRECSKSFCLLPRNGSHDEVLFPASDARFVVGAADEDDEGSDSTDSNTSATARCGPRIDTSLRYPLFRRDIPQLPEDFIGREVDVWSVLQLLNSRRAVVVCGAQGEAHGVGKSAVLNAVHRTFSLQLGGTCVAVNMGSLREPNEIVLGGGWISKVKDAVRSAFKTPGYSLMANAPQRGSFAGMRHRHTASGLRRRVVSSGFHPLSDPIAVEPQLRELVEDMVTLADDYEAQRLGAATTSGQILLILDECDHLIQQRHFQDALADILMSCPAYGVVLSTQQRMVGTAGGQFKVVHHEMRGLTNRDAARLFMRRAQRPLHWDELSPEGSASASVTAAMARAGARDPREYVRLSKACEDDVYSLLSSHPLLSAQRGNPRRLIELANSLSPALPCFSECVTCSQV